MGSGWRPAWQCRAWQSPSLRRPGGLRVSSDSDSVARPVARHGTQADRTRTLSAPRSSAARGRGAPWRPGAPAPAAARSRWALRGPARRPGPGPAAGPPSKLSDRDQGRVISRWADQLPVPGLFHDPGSRLSGHETKVSQSFVS